MSASPGTKDVIKHGWLLKKRRRKMQGFTTRYFKLHASGLFSYSVHPDVSPRDQILLSAAVISSSPTLKLDLHIDSDFSTFHIKFRNDNESEQWMREIRKFIQPTPAHDAELPVSNTSPKQATDLLDEMGSTIKEMNNTVSQMRQEDFSLKSPNLFKFRRDREKDNSSGKEGERIFQRFRKGSYNDSSQSVQTETASTNSTPSLDLSSKVTGFSRLERLSAALQAMNHQYEQLRVAVDQLVQQRPAVLYPMPDTASTLHRSRMSVRTVLSSSPSELSVWHDALDRNFGGEGGLEFVIDDDHSDEPHSPSISEDEVSLQDDSELNQFGVSTATENAPPGGDTPTIEAPFPRRSILPAPMTGDEGSLFTALKRNIGKDLSNVSFPVTFNEPISLLQRLCEDLEYDNLLDMAVASQDACERMSYVAAFAVSGFACTQLRNGRKSFTPMMGETFEDVRSNFIAEKVSHAPLIMACHAHGNGWEYWSTHSGKTKFWGKSLEILQTGTTHLKLGEDHYRWQRPSTFVRNLMLGTKYLEHCGQLTIINGKDMMRCSLGFKETGYWGGTSNLVSGQIQDRTGSHLAQLEGSWHDQLAQVLDSSHLKILWRANAFPRHAPSHYGLTYFATSLNEITSGLEGKLPMTDSRYRPDIRAMEEGKISDADREKVRLEELQRERRAKSDPILLPKWFERAGDSDEFVYKGGYWEQRKKGWPSRKAVW